MTVTPPGANRLRRLARCGAPRHPTPGADSSGGDWRVVTLAVGLAVVTLLAAVAWHLPCLGPWHGQQYSHACYTDLQSLWHSRALLGSHQLPYRGDDGFFEYPAVTAVLAWGSGLLAGTPDGFWWVELLVLLGPALVGSVAALARLVGHRAWMLALAPTVVLTGAVNWDLLAVAASTLGLLAWRRGHAGWAAAAWTLGVWVKLYPLMLLLALAGEVLAERDRAKGRRLFGVVAGVSVAVNLPFAALAPAGWMQALLTQLTRQARDVNSLWSLLPLPEPVAGMLGTAATLAACGLLPWLGLRAARRGGQYRLPDIALGLTAATILFGRVHSPQYDLWLLPLLAVSSLSWRWWFGYAAASVALTLTTFAALTPAGVAAGSPAHLGNTMAAASMCALLAGVVAVTAHRAGTGGPAPASSL